ncbi:MAG: selenate reductase, partial [Bacilli bacterium]
MSDVMRPISFERIMNRIKIELAQDKSVYSVNKLHYCTQTKRLDIFNEQLENPLGPAAGPHTQLAQNIISAYVAGARFFELKTVQILDGTDLHIDKPCIRADDEAYNIEWSSELFVPEALEEYVKAWFGIKLIAKEYGFGDPDAFIFNMSVGYNLEGIKSPKIDAFINGLKDASNLKIWEELQAYALNNLGSFKNIDAAYVKAISPNVCTSITLSTMHGCPADEIEAITSYLIKEKKINTYLKCNPTLLGYDFVEKTFKAMNYDYIEFSKEQFDNDLKYDDAIVMIKKLQGLAAQENISFGVKLSNTFQVKVNRGELAGSDMYMSGKSLYPLTISLAA